jgi:ubiquinone/menaquinone biosynthesis C-methylase UbiE
MAMGLYQDHVLPLLIHLSMRQQNLAAYRARVLSAAQGRVLEIGIGSGLNLPYYSTTVEQVIGLDPSPKLLAMAREAARRTSLPLELIENSAETIPLYNRSIDTVVSSWTMCSIPDVQRALGEMRRVLKPEGRLLFVEHGRSPDPGVRRWQDRLTPVWRRVGGGCHLNRPIGELIEAAGFRIERIETGYMRGPKPMTFMYEGSARPR